MSEAVPLTMQIKYSLSQLAERFAQLAVHDLSHAAEIVGDDPISAAVMTGEATAFTAAARAVMQLGEGL